MRYVEEISRTRDGCDGVDAGVQRSVLRATHEVAADGQTWGKQVEKVRRPLQHARKGLED